jgi:putative membrane protein
MRLLTHFLQGLLMGGADIIPGVSGGTMALIVGIYRRLIDAISDGVSALLLIVRGRIGEGLRALRALPWTLLGPLLTGIALAIVVGSLFIPYLLDTYPVQCRALFFGLVAASLIIPWRERHHHRAWHYGAAALAALVAFFLVGLPRSGDAADPGMLRVFASAAVAINAMILPGVSGAFLLEVLGLYSATLDALRSLDLGYIAVFALGAATGLGAFAKLLGWLLEHHHDATMAVLVGLLAGSLRALWPWVAFLTHESTADDGTVETEYVPDPSQLFAPGTDGILPPGVVDPGFAIALALALAGFAFVTALAWFGRKRIATGDETLAEEL